MRELGGDEPAIGTTAPAAYLWLKVISTTTLTMNPGQAVSKGGGIVAARAWPSFARVRHDKTLQLWFI